MGTLKKFRDAAIQEKNIPVTPEKVQPVVSEQPKKEVEVTEEVKPSKKKTKKELE
jgi:hypothetical protein